MLRDDFSERINRVIRGFAVLVLTIVNTEKCIFYAVVEGILSYGWEIWTVKE